MVAGPVSSQDVSLAGRVIDETTGFPIPAALVELLGSGGRTWTDGDGRFRFTASKSSEEIRLRVSVAGYHFAQRTVSPDAGEVVIALQPRPIELEPLTARGRRAPRGGAVERALWEREPRTGIVGVSATELAEVPAMVEADVMRGLHALPGIVQKNDLSAELHVLGGAPDQTAYYLDGARIFAPHHLFGVMGAFNTAALRRVELYRGALPPRQGGVLAGVVDVQQKDGGESVAGDGSLSLLGASAALGGGLPLADGRWMLAARRTHLDALLRVFRLEFPYAFHDMQGRVSFRPAPDQRVRVSLFHSADRFSPPFERRLLSRWSNLAASGRWQLDGPRWDQAIEATWSGYETTFRVGEAQTAIPAENRLGIGTLRWTAARQGERIGLRVGADVEAGRVRVEGSPEPGAYIVGGDVRGHMTAAVHAEPELSLGPLRVSPGLRVGRDIAGGRWLTEPRLTGRLHLTEHLAVTAGLTRTMQILSTLRDDRTVFPGAPFWVRHPKGDPASAADGAAVAVDGWLAEDWSFSAGAWGRRLRDVMQWRPEGFRTLDGVTYDDGEARGIELFVRRHNGRLTGWLAYTFSVVELETAGTGERYWAAWDQRHTADLNLAYRSEFFTLAGRVAYGSGTPFWPFIGYTLAPDLNTPNRRIEWSYRDGVPIWSDQQMRYPDSFRLDLAVRLRAGLFETDSDLVLNLVNATGRPNVLYYRLEGRNPDPADPESGAYPVLVPVQTSPITILPSIGIHVRF